MGLKDSRRIVEDAIELHKERMYSPYSVFLEGPPTFVTYLSTNRINTTYTMGTNVHYAEYGDKSPIKYSAINNLPIWKFQQITLDSIDLQDGVGLEADISGDAIIAPGTIVPIPGDMFIVNYLSKKLIFEVIEAKPNIINSNHYYKIDFQLKYANERDFESLFELNIIDRYECIYENIGTDLKSVIRSEEFDSATKLNELYEEIAYSYFDIFYEAITNSFISEYGSIKTYNQYLVDFFNKNKIFTRIEKFSYLTLTTEVDKEPIYLNKYRGSIYGIIEDRNLKRLKYNDLVLLNGDYPRFSIFSQYGYDYHICHLIDTSEKATYEKLQKFILTSIISDKLFNMLKSDEENEIQNLNLIENIIYKFMKKDFIISSKNIDDIKEYFEDVTNYDYYTTPILLYIIKFSIEFYSRYKSNYKLKLDNGGIDNI